MRRITSEESSLKSNLWRPAEKVRIIGSKLCSHVSIIFLIYLLEKFEVQFQFSFFDIDCEFYKGTKIYYLKLNSDLYY